MKKQFRLIAVFLVMILALAACNDEGDNESSETSNGSSEVVQSSTEGVVSSEEVSSEEVVTNNSDLSLEEVMKNAEAYYADAKSLEYNIDISTMGQNMTSVMRLDENANMMAETTIQGQTLVQYLINDGGDYTQYISSDGQNYVKSTLETGAEDIESARNQPTSSMPMTNLDIFSMTTNSDGNYVITGEPTLAEVADDEAFRETIEGQSSSEVDFSEYTSTIPITAVVDKNDFHYVELSIDMSAFMTEMMDKLMAEFQTSDSSAPSLGPIEMKMTMKDMKRDTVDPIVLPAEAENADEMEMPDTTQLPQPAPTTP